MSPRELPTGTVTLLFSDIEGSTRLLQRAGDAYAELLADHRRLLSEAFERHGGCVVDAEGDAFFVAFPAANEAVAAAADAQLALAEHAWPDEHEVRVRIGLHTGEPRALDGRYIGLDVHHGARVMAAGHGGQVLISEATRALLDDRFQLRDLGEHRLKDLSGPQRLFQLQVEGLPGEFPPLKTLENRPTNLPVLAHGLVGREHELGEARALLTREDVRLLTLTGAGGSGKTRLALQVAAELVDEFENGVFFVPLAQIRDWELVVPTIAQTLGLREQPGETRLETLTEYVRDKRLLLLLDNFEQVVPATPVVSGILSAAPGLRVLATSRTPLRLSGERTYPVPPLVRDEALRLFVERAQAADPEFRLDGNAQAVAEICERLDGLPLAIELAAPRVRTLPPPALLRRLDQRLDLLTGGARDVDERQRTLRATIAWSYELLPDAERAMFAKLGVFVGGCRLEAAGALCGTGNLDLLDGLESLVENSLVQQRPDPDGEPRFWMLETIREYALELLEASGRLESARAEHAAYFRALAERVDTEARTGDQAALFALLESEKSNLRAARDWARDNGERETLLALATALWGFWQVRGYIAEGRAALEEALSGVDDPPARALLGLASLRISSGEPASRTGAEEALAACERLGDNYSLAQAWNVLGHVEAVLGQMRKAEEAWRRGLEYAVRGGYAAEKGESAGWLLVAAIFGPLPVREGIELSKRFEAEAGADPTIRAWCRVERSTLEAMQGNFELARQLLAEGKRALDDLGLHVYALNTAQGFYYIEMLAENPAAAAPILRETFEALEQTGERAFLSTIAGLLAHASYALDDDGEAERAARSCELLAAADDVVSQILWRTARAKVRARAGAFEEAEALAREAVAIAEGIDFLSTQGDALLDLAEVLRLAGRKAEALIAVDEAAERYERKGNLASLERARRLAKTLAA